MEWDERAAGKAPLVLIEVRSGEGIRPPAKGDRVLAKIEATPGQDYPFKARVIRALSDRSKRVLGVFRLVKGHGARLIPVDKKARNELQVRSGDENGALDGELVEAEILKDHGRGLPLARVRTRLGDMNDQRNISLIAIHHHAIPNEFSERVLAESEALKAFNPAGRVDLAQNAVDHDRSARCARP